MLWYCPNRVVEAVFCGRGSMLWARVISASFFALAAIFAVGMQRVLAQTLVEIEVNHTPEVVDDYVCWSPVPVRIRLRDSAAEPLGILITSSKAIPELRSGEVYFAEGDEEHLSRNQFRPVDSLAVELPAGGSWAYLHVAGKVASTNDGDVRIFVSNSDTGERVGERPLMVRVRKNAERLTNGEIQRFLTALAGIHSEANLYNRYWRMHQSAIDLAHGGPAFLAWHRALLLSVERELQARDPSVALPYWEFDKPASNLFSVDFIGRIDRLSFTDPTLVKFSPNNPLFGWTVEGLGPLYRNRNGDQQTNPRLRKTFMERQGYGWDGGTRPMWPALENFYHGGAHIWIGGWLGDVGRSPADPLFFLLHANVDRAWASWQRLRDRFDGSEPRSYWPPGAYRAGSPFLFGNFAEDTMWPWDGITGPNDPNDSGDDRPDGWEAMPAPAGPEIGPGDRPTTSDMVDYLDLLGRGMWQGYCYDTVPYGVGSVDDFWRP